MRECTLHFNHETILEVNCRDSEIATIAVSICAAATSVCDQNHVSRPVADGILVCFGGAERDRAACGRACYADDVVAMIEIDGGGREVVGQECKVAGLRRVYDDASLVRWNSSG